MRPWIRAARLAGWAASTATAGAQTPWTVDAKPVVDIPGTGAGGVLVFEHVIAGARLSNGTIVLADQAAAIVRFFDASGRATQSVGRPGSGPGEFQMIFWLGQCGADSVFVWDFRLGRMTAIAATGGIVRQHPPSSILRRGTPVVPRPLGAVRALVRRC
jgi:hypothetical protein